MFSELVGRSSTLLSPGTIRPCQGCQMWQLPVYTTSVRLYYRCPTCAHGWSEPLLRTFGGSVEPDTEVLTFESLFALLTETADILQHLEDQSTPPTLKHSELVRRQFLLEVQTQLLSSGLPSLQGSERDGSEAQRHKLRQQQGRVQSHRDDVLALGNGLP